MQSIPDTREADDIHPKSFIPKRAAQYVRMSTDHQQYSIQGQKEAIAEYAALNGIEIVRTYADEHKSGLTIKRRPALKRLIRDIQDGHRDYDVVLVYDVSRWGRFQDTDESAYYEFICRAHGVPVIYCVENFENDGRTLSALIKVLKRAMAAEYSRELSMKVARAHKYYAELGFHQGGTPNYGLRRFLVDGFKNPKMKLDVGQQKHLQTDRVILIPGPDHEVQTVREMFRLFVIEHMPQWQIAQHFNNKGIRNARGKPWSKSNICLMLANEKYAGTFVYCRSNWPLEGGRTPNPKKEWVRVEGAIEPIVDRETFDAAQRLLNRWAFTNNQLLDYLTAAWCSRGYLSAPSLNRNEIGPWAVTYREHFGSLANAYSILGYKAVHAYRYSRYGEHLRLIHRNLICRLTAAAGHRGPIKFDEEKQVLHVDGILDVAVIVLPYLPRANTVQPGWKLYLDRLEPCDVILLGRMNKANAELLDYYLLPRTTFSGKSFRFTDETIKQFRRYKLRALDGFYPTLKRRHINERARRGRRTLVPTANQIRTY